MSLIQFITLAKACQQNFLDKTKSFSQGSGLVRDINKTPAKGSWNKIGGGTEI